MPTLRDIADRAGVNPSTVSRVLNGREGVPVSEKTRRRVLAIAKELGYRPNRIAQSLRRRRSHLLGLIIADIRNVSASELYLGALRAARAEGFELLLWHSDDDPVATREGAVMLAEQAGGIIWATALRRDPLVDEFIRHQVPLALLGRKLDADASDHRFPTVVPDDVGGARMVVRHLADQGYTRIAHVGGPRETSTGQDRWVGYRHGLAECQLEFHDDLVVVAGFRERDGYLGMRRLLANDAVPEAVFAVTDMAALGALRAIREAGLRVPEDIALAGFDDSPLMEYVFPPLTTVRVPAAAMGSMAVQRLLESFTAPEEASVTTQMPVELVVRGSSMRQPATAEGKKRA